MKNIWKGLSLLIVMTGILFQLTTLQGRLVPIQLEVVTSPAAQALQKMGIKDDKLAETYDLVGDKTGIRPEMLIALTHTESNFDKKAVSSKGYKGLMQIKPKLTSQDAHVFEGATVLKDKLRITGGDMRRAIALYKGYGNRERGLQQADKVIKLYKQLIEV